MKKVGTHSTIACILILCYGCATINPSVFNPTKKVRETILPLEVHILDLNTTEEFFGGQTKLLSDERILEARYLIYKEFKNNIFSASDKKYGYAFCKIKRDAGINFAWLVPFASTIGLLGLLGFPAHSQTAEVEVELTIFNANKDVIAMYTATGDDTEYTALYWGHEGAGYVSFNNPLSQLVNAKALLNAFSKLKKQIQVDAQKINSKLIETI